MILRFETFKVRKLPTLEALEVVTFCPQKCSGEWVWLRQCLATERKKYNNNNKKRRSKGTRFNWKFKKKVGPKILSTVAICFGDKNTFFELQLSSSLVILYVFSKMLASFSIVNVCSRNSHVLTLRASMTSLVWRVLGNVDITGSIIKPGTRNTINSLLLARWVLKLKQCFL